MEQQCTENERTESCQGNQYSYNVDRRGVAQFVDNLFRPCCCNFCGLPSWAMVLKEAAGFTEPSAELFGLNSANSSPLLKNESGFGYPAQLGWSLVEQFQNLQMTSEEFFPEDDQPYHVPWNVSIPSTSDQVGAMEVETGGLQHVVQQHLEEEQHGLNVKSYSSTLALPVSPTSGYMVTPNLRSGSMQMKERAQKITHGFQNQSNSRCRPSSNTKPRCTQRFCGFCLKNQEKFELFSSHTLYYPTGGKLRCPILRRYVCKTCGATGDNAHTASYCPYNKERLQKGITQLESTMTSAEGLLNHVCSETTTPHVRLLDYKDNFPPLKSNSKK